MMRKMGWMSVFAFSGKWGDIRGIQRYQRRLPSCWQVRKHLSDQLDYAGV
jgi:hypothetical protein